MMPAPGDTRTARHGFGRAHMVPCVRRSVTIALVLMALAAPQAWAAAAPPTLPGWPRAAPAGPLMQGPQGGVVVVAQDGSAFTAAAYRRDGRRLWAYRRVAGCGNCDDGPQPVALQPDGTYGPIGFEGDDIWAVDARGRQVAGCAGAVFPDSTCIVGTDVADAAFRHSPALVARGPSGWWSVADRRYLWQDEFGVAQMTVRDGTGLIHAAFAAPRDAVGGGTLPGVLLTVDPVARAIVATRVGPTQVLAALPAGVLVAEAGRIVALSPDGSERWSRPFTTRPSQVLVDAARDRVYVGPAFDGVPVVRALSLSTGATLWRTATADRARLMSVGRGGRVYLAIDAPGRRAARGVRLANGSTAWQHRTAQPVLGVRELVNGTVAISAGSAYAGSSGGRMTIIDPR